MMVVEDPVEVGRLVGLPLGLLGVLLRGPLSSQKALRAGVVSGNSGSLLTPVVGSLKGYRMPYPWGSRGGRAP